MKIKFENDSDNEANQETKTKDRKATIPPDGYVCKLCDVAGHWIQQCPERKQQKNKRKLLPAGTTEDQPSYKPGIEPSPQDIERARALQALPPPLCDCGVKSRLKKVKKSRVTEGSRANGKYFFFCAKRRDDATKCNFAQLVEDPAAATAGGLPTTPKEKAHAHFFANKRRKDKEGGTATTT